MVDHCSTPLALIFCRIGQHCIFVNAQPGNDPRFFAVFWRIANAAFQHVAVIGARDFLAVDNISPCSYVSSPNYGFQQFTAPCPQQASNAEHFATTERKTDILQLGLMA